MTETEKPAARKPGRPRKFGRGRINTTVRFTPERYEKLRIEAERNGRSVSEQVEFMIEQASLGLAEIVETAVARALTDASITPAVTSKKQDDSEDQS